MSILVTADWHVSDSAKDRYRFRALEWILDYVAKHKVGTVIILGDLTHNKNYHSDTLVNDLVNLLHQFSRVANVIVLKGNHDYVEADTPFFHFLRLLPRVTYINQPRTLDTEAGRCYFLPHTRNHEKDWKDLQVDWADCDSLFFAHNSFEGAQAESGKRLSGIPLSVFPRGYQIIAGDIHAPQEIEAHGVRLTYVGAPYRMNFGDGFTPRVLLLNKGKVSSIEVPGPQKRLVEVTSIEELEKCVQDTCWPEDMIKVRYRLPLEDRDQWSGIKKRIQEITGGCMVQVILEQGPLKQASVQRARKDDEVLRAYGEQQDVPPAMMVTGYELLNEV